MSSDRGRSFPPRFLERVRARVLRGNEQVRRMLERSRSLLETHAPREGDANAPSSDAWIEVSDEFATPTMASILAQQGRRAEAIDLLEKLVRDPTHSAQAQRLLSSLQQTEVPSQLALRSEEPTSMLDRVAPPESYGSSTCRALPVDPRTLVVYWELAQDVAVDNDPLCIEVVSYVQRADGETLLRRVIEDVPRVGNVFVRALEPGTVHHAALGVFSSGQFVPILEAMPVSTPRGRPVEQLVETRATLVLPPRAKQPGAVPWVVPQPTVQIPPTREAVDTKVAELDADSTQVQEWPRLIAVERMPSPTPPPVSEKLIVHPVEPVSHDAWIAPLTTRPKARRPMRTSASDVWYESFDQADSSAALLPSSDSFLSL